MIIQKTIGVVVQFRGQPEFTFENGNERHVFPIGEEIRSDGNARPSIDLALHGKVDPDDVFRFREHFSRLIK